MTRSRSQEAEEAKLAWKLDPSVRETQRIEDAKDKRAMLRTELYERDQHRLKRADRLIELLRQKMSKFEMPDLEQDIVLETAKLEIQRGEDHTKVMGFCNQAIQQWVEQVQQDDPAPEEDDD